MLSTDYPLVYIAGPLFTEGERWYLERVSSVCEELGCATYLPHRDAGLCPPSGEEGAGFFNKDLEMLGVVDVVIAVLNGKDVDSGTAWEIGYGYALGKIIIGIVDDTRVNEPEANINLMVFNSLRLCRSFEELKHAVAPIIKSRG